MNEEATAPAPATAPVAAVPSTTGKRAKTHYDEIERTNVQFVDYYKRQGLVPEEEWPALMEALGKSLPTTFRLTGHREEAVATGKHLQEELLPTLGAAAHALPWYRPSGFAFHLDTDRKTLRTDKAMEDFHKWLVAATENGDISRQEAVSMIPPLLLDVRRDHLVLDMCAAPGSKTAQLVEYMHADAQLTEGAPTTGLVVANDADQQRAYMLYHQVKRILSPCLLVANNDGTMFPYLHVRRGDGTAERRLFDRILADVPCSGDGTLRKNAQLWKSWNVGLGVGLHPLQVRLLEKAARLLKVGGRIVYSTCSMNFVENEAVVAHVVGKYRHALELVDVSAQLSGLVRRPGRASWRVIGREGVEYGAPDSVPDGQKRRYPASIFPRDDYADLGLERCLRIYAHLQNTGAFFIAVISKRADLHVDSGRDKGGAKAEDGGVKTEDGAKTEDGGVKTEDGNVKAEGNINTEGNIHTENTTRTEDTIGTEDRASRPAKKGTTRYHVANKAEGEFRLLDVATEPALDNIFDWYGIDKQRMVGEGFGFLVRSERDPIRVISIVSPTARPIFEATVPPHRQDAAAAPAPLYNGSLKIVNAGVRAFEAYESNRPIPVGCIYRPLAESVSALRPFMTKRVVRIAAEEMVQLLESQDSVRLSIGETLGQGGAVFEAAAVRGSSTVSIPVWISERGVKAFVASANRPAVILQLKQPAE